jgi:RNA polymerase sigma factor (sigma-70 family)
VFQEGHIDLAGFYAGDRQILTQVYRAHVRTVERAVMRYCRGVDAECIVHDVFLSVVEKKAVRENFKGGKMGAWLATIAANRALDHLRRTKRRAAVDQPCSDSGELPAGDEEERLLHRDQMAHLSAAMDSFSEQVLPQLPAQLGEVFELRFRQHLPQIQAAKTAGIARTTFIDREQRLMKPLGRWIKNRLGAQS